MNKYERYKKVDLPWLEEVPEHWEVKRNKSIFKEKKEVVGERFIDYKLLSLTLRGVIERNLDGGGKFPASFEKYVVVKSNDFVFCLFDMDETPRTIGLSLREGMITGAYTIFEAYTNYSSQFLNYFYLYIDSIKGLKPYYSGLRKTVNMDKFNSIKIPTPPLDEQEKIAAYLDWKINEIDRLIAVEKEKILELQRLLSTKVDRIFDDLLRVSVSKIRMRFLYEFQNGISTSKDYTNGEFPFLTYSDVYNNLIVPEKLGGRINSDGKEQEIYSIDEGDLFVTRTSERIEDAGKVSLALHKVENAVFNGFTIRLHPKANNNFLAKFILYYLNSAIVREKIINSLNLVTRVSIKQEILKEVSVPVVSIEEQQHTVESIEELSNTFQSEIASLQSKINYFSSLKHSLISEVVTGKIDVRNVVIPIYEKVDVSVSTNEEEVEE